MAMKNDTYLRSLETNIPKENNGTEDNGSRDKISSKFDEDTLIEKINQEEDSSAQVQLDLLDESAQVLFDSLDESTQVLFDSLDESAQVLFDSLDESAQVLFDSLDESAQVQYLFDDSTHIPFPSNEIVDELLSIIEKTKNDNNVVVTLENIEKETTKNAVKETMENSEEETQGSGPKQVVIRKRDGMRAPRKLEICEECGKATRNLSAHSKAHSPEAKANKNQCELCKKKFASARSCRKHILFVHMGFRNKCPICGKGVRLLNNHIRKIHQQDQLPYQCTVCQKRFLTTTILEQHMITHTKDKSYACELCDKRYSQMICLENHVREIHENERNHMCQFCSKRFFKKHHLVLHLRKHTKEKPHECPECGKCFSSIDGLKSHRVIHSDLKPYPCTVCGHKFSKPTYLSNHMLTHTKEKKYPCKYCGVLFGRIHHKKRHEFTAHEKDVLYAP